MKESKHERALAAALEMYGSDLEPHVREAKAIPGRDFRFDFAFTEARVLIEIQGGTFAKGRSAHTGASLMRDFEKQNLAVCNGWRVLLFGARDMTARTLPATVDTIRKAIAAKEAAV